MKISAKIKTDILSMNLNVLQPDSIKKDYFEMKFMRFYRLSENCPDFTKFENCQICSMEIIRAQPDEILVVLNFDPCLKCCKRMGISRPLNLWAVELGVYCSNVYGKISAIPLIILNSVFLKK